MTTCERRIQMGDVGVIIERTVKQKNATGVWVVVNLSTVSSVVLRLRSPSGVIKNFTGTLTTDGTDGKVQYTTTATSDLDEAGHWLGQFRLTFGSGLQKTQKFHFDVEEGL